MQNFEQIVASLLESLKIQAPKISAGQFFVELSDGLKVNIICNWENNVILVANVGGTQDNTQELLWHLLEKNLFCELPHIQISASAEDKKIILWTQERLSQLDSRSLNALFERFARRAAEISVILAGQKQRQPKAVGDSSLRNRTRLGAPVV